MRVTWAILCDYYIRDVQTGNSSLVGVFSRAGFPSFPRTLVSFYLALRFESEVSDTSGVKDCRVSLVDQDGRELAKGSLTVDLPNVSPENEISVITAFRFDMVQFYEAGKHRFDIFIDGVTAGSTSLEIIRTD
ncbi:MAG TPA: hypothetical protein VGL56_17780 [Fimbriimonadaceae bacterium]|jgi:hypothetical protein